MSVFSYPSPPPHARFSCHRLEHQLSAASAAAELLVEFLLREVSRHTVYGQVREGALHFLKQYRNLPLVCPPSWPLLRRTSLNTASGLGVTSPGFELCFCSLGLVFSFIKWGRGYQAAQLLWNILLDIWRWDLLVLTCYFRRERRSRRSRGFPIFLFHSKLYFRNLVGEEWKNYFYSEESRNI